MEPWRDELYHHGIKGMKWGVRRFQNPDGSLTEAGRKRYGVQFYKEEKNVRERCSNAPKDISVQPINIGQVKARGKLKDQEALECIEQADKVFKKAQKVEPQITNDILDAANKTGNNMYGLNFRLKQPSSIAAKIGSDAKEDEVSFKDAAKGLKDVVRYTTVSEDSNFVSNYKKMKKELEKKGYSEEVCKNFFDLYNKGIVKHKSVQCTYKTPDGYKFEIQFQTVKSQTAKELKIPIYEARRQAGLTDIQKKTLEDQMEALAMRVTTPIDIDEIKTHK